MELFYIGRIVNAHGIKGEVRIMLVSDDPQRFDELEQAYIIFDDNNDKKKLYNIESVRYHKQFVLVKFEGIDDRDAALRLRNGEVKVEEGLELGKNEYYYKDIILIDVYSDEGKFLGQITDILTTGANDVYEVSNEGKSFLIPAIRECVKSVDLNENKMIIHIMEGLFD